MAKNTIIDKISTNILNILRRQWLTRGNALNYEKFIDEVIKGFILTEVLAYHKKGYQVYTLGLRMFLDTIQILRPSINPRGIYYRVMKNLEKKGYFYCIDTGYKLENECGEVDSKLSTYCTTEKFAKILDEICKNELQYVKIDINKLHSNKRGITKRTILKYDNGKFGKNHVEYEYTNFHDLCRQICFTGMTLEQVNQKKKELKENSTVARVETIIPIDSCIISTTTAGRFNPPLNYTYSNSTYLDIEEVNEIAKRDCKNDTIDKSERNAILALRRIDVIMDHKQEGQIDVYYRSSKYGRLYQFGGYNIQLIPKEYRNKILSIYISIDMKAAFFSLMYNYAKINGYEGELPYLQRMFDDPDAYRKNVWNDIKKYDPQLEYEYVKTGFTAMGYGAKISEKQIEAAVKYNMKTALVAASGYYDKFTPERLAAHPDFKGLGEDIKKVKKFIIKNVKSTKKKRLTNEAGAVINISTCKGKEIIPFVYQGMEVKALFAILSFFDGMKDPCGLLLHDGLYIRRECMVGVTLENIQEHVFNETGYSLKFSLENE